MGVQTLASSQAEGGHLGAVLAKGTGGGNYTSASTTYVAIDSTNLVQSLIIPKGFIALISAGGDFFTATASVQFGVAITDGGATAVLVEVNPVASSVTLPIPVGLTWAVVGDGLGHTFGMSYKTTAGADLVTCVNNSATHLPYLLVELTQSSF